MFLSYSRLKPWDSGVGLKVSQHIWSLLCDEVKPVSHLVLRAGLSHKDIKQDPGGGKEL